MNTHIPSVVRAAVLFLVVLPAGVIPGCTSKDASWDGRVVALTGEPLEPPAVSAERAAALGDDLQAAETALERHPQSEDAAIWLGRRLAYLHRYQEAIEAFTRGLQQHPDSPRLLRHRGHRYITVRRFDDAIADLSRAAALTEDQPDEIEPDGSPNERNIPRSTLKTNIWYHLGLAYYLKGEFTQASEAYGRCVDLCTNDDMRVATLHWLYMSLRRSGKDEQAQTILQPVREAMDIIENHEYHRLLLMYVGMRTPEEVLGEAGEGVGLASSGYGVGNWYLVNSDQARATELWERVVRETPWPAFGHIAAEAELAGAARSSAGVAPAPTRDQ
jgi:tetratricopeptide (TPR) repeat protein